MVIKDVESLELTHHLQLLIQYLSVLQDGRTKPDTKGGGYIRESVYNIDEIESVKEQINQLLRVNVKPKSIEFIDKTKNNYFKN
jgi:hypothetical protein